MCTVMAFEFTVATQSEITVSLQAEYICIPFQILKTLSDKHQKHIPPLFKSVINHISSVYSQVGVEFIVKQFP